MRRPKSSGLTQDSAPWAIVGIKIVRWIRHWDEKHQPITLPLIEAWLLARLLAKKIKKRQAER